ncbi:MAG: right-handed parallel beta-helix repeat-containing protein [bacterium]|nr:right-handed parallel beta-helix repeat-containing protein [bacterium]
MREKLGAFLILFFAAFQLIMATTCLAKVIRVAKSGGDYTSIQAAINAASAGDTIEVGPGVYNENITINKNLDLIGAGATTWIPQPPLSGGIAQIEPGILIAKYPITKPPLPDPPPEIFNPTEVFNPTLGLNIRARDDLSLINLPTINLPTTITLPGSILQPSPIIQLPGKEIDYPGPTSSLAVKIPSYGSLYAGPQILIPGQIKPFPNGSIIQGKGSGHVVTFTGVSAGSIRGFTITNSGSQHAGIMLYNSRNLTIACNRLSKNKDGIVASSSSAIVRNNVFDENGFSDNSLCDYGLCCLKSTLSITNNLVINQEVGLYIAWEESSGTAIINNTITGNRYDGVWCYRSSPVIKNNIITQNGYGICAIYSAAPEISYNDVWGNGQDYNQQTGGLAAPGPGDISADPLFVNPDEGDYHLDLLSPCIDAGDPNPIYNDPDGSRNDMGLYGGQGGSLGTPAGQESGFVFTDIGLIPTAAIPQDQDDPSFGLAKVSQTMAEKLRIPQWVDSPFGGQIRIFGQFGQLDQVDFYQILAARWKNNDTTAPSDSDFLPLKEPLAKVKTTIDGGKVNHEIVTLGPVERGGFSSLYELNKGEWWSQPTLRLIWNTTAWPNGKYTLKCRAFKWNSSKTALIDATPSSSIPLTIIINNSPPAARIHWVKYSSSNPNYDPAVDGNIPECGLIHLTHNRENLRFVITASHPEGYLDYFNLDCLWGKNRPGGVICYQNYATATPSSPHIWYGVSQQEFSLPSSFNQWENCAYQFRLYARSRATDGYTHLYGREFNDHYTIEIGSGSACTSSGVAGDLNNDGRVTIDELTRVINAFLGRK